MPQNSTNSNNSHLNNSSNPFSNTKPSNTEFAKSDTNRNHVTDMNETLSPPKSKFGFQEIVILLLILFIIALAVIAGIIFFNVAPFGGSSKSSSSTSKTSTYTTTVSSSSSSSKSSASSTYSTSISSSSSTTLSQSSTSSSISSTSKSSSSQSSSNTTNSSTTSASVSSGSTSSSTTSVAGNLKVYFTKGSSFDLVGRDSTATTTYQKTIDAVLAKVKGPTASEISSGYSADLNLTGESNCAGGWFELDTSGGKVSLKFCRTVTLTGAVADGLLEQSLNKTLMDNSGLSKVMILNKDGNCLFNAAGTNACKN